MLEVNCTNKTPDLFEMNLYLKRIARGHFVMAGNITIGVDLTDETIISAKVFYSPMAQHFMPTPFHIPQITLSKFMNTYYKDFALDGLKECATNPPLNDSSEKFIPPWSKGVMILENCTFPNDNMPSHMRSGYYRSVVTFAKQVETYYSLLIKIEPK